MSGSDRERILRPTNGELVILGVLWHRGASTVREVAAALGDEGSTVGYTTVLKQLQIMTEKGLVMRDTSRRAHVYAASHPREETQRGMVRDMADRVFGGSAGQLILRALSGGVSAEERAEIRALLDSEEKTR